MLPSSPLTLRTLHGFLVAARPLYLSGAVMLFALGVVLGRGHPRPLPVACGALVVVLVHVITHWVNDAEDVATDDRTASPTALTGGSRAIQRGLIEPRELLRGAWALSALVVGVALVEAVAGEPAASGAQIAILVLGYAYSGRPFVCGRRGLGEVVTATVMGVLVPLAGALAAGGMNAAVRAVMALLFVATVFARLCTAYPDIDADRATGKRTILVLLGRARSPLAFVAVAVVMAAVAALCTDPLPRTGWQRAAAVLVALAALAASWLIRTGRAERAPVLVPMLGVAAYGASLGVLLLAALL